MKNFINPLAFTDDLTELDNSDLILVRDASNSKKNTQITFSNLKSAITGIVTDNTILNGGINSPDEDVTILFGGNGISKNSNTINNG